MYSKGKKRFVWLLTIAFLATQFFVASPLLAESTGSTIGTGLSTETDAPTATGRISGADRYKTAVAVSQKGWNTADYAVLARGDNFADALCAGPLAKKYGGPILLTEPGELNSDTLQELKRLGVKHLFIAGGPGAVSQNVEDALKAAGIAVVERISGDNRYETSIKIAEKIGLSSKAVLATGSDYPDALSISVIASVLGMPILLTAKDSLPASVKDYLNQNSFTQTYIIGGTGVISSALEKKLPGPTRLAGSNRYDTNKVILQYFGNNLNFENIYVAIGGGPKGNEFADALTGAVLAAKTSSPLVLTGQTLPARTAAYLQTKLKLSTKVLGLGGKSAVPTVVLTGLVAAKEQIPVKKKYSTAGTYGPETGIATIEGSVIISSPDITLRNTIIEGDLLLGSSIGDGNVSLLDVTVHGKTIINGGGPNSVIMYNFNGETVIVEVPDNASIRLVAQGETYISNVFMEGNGILEESDLSGQGFITVEIPAGAEVTLNGDFEEVNVEAAGANITVASGVITTMRINAQANITGEGQITNAYINASGVSVAQTPSNVAVAPGYSANVGGQQLGKDDPTARQNQNSGEQSFVSVNDISITNACTVTFNTDVTASEIKWNNTALPSQNIAKNGNTYTITVASMKTDNKLSVAATGYLTYTQNNIKPAFAWANSLNTSWYTGNESSLCFEINSASQMAGLAKLVNEGNDFSGKIIKLTADLDLLNCEWTPVGTSGTKFKGAFDGQNYTVSNLKIDNPAAKGIGLFGYAYSPVNLKNLKINNVRINAKESVGSLAGNIVGTVQNVDVSNVTIESTHWAGGLIGYGYANVSSCAVHDVSIALTFDTAIDDNGDKAGGLMGFQGEGSFIVQNCQAEDITISGVRDVGGLVGSSNAGPVYLNCQVTEGEVKALNTLGKEDENPWAGGVIGRAAGASITLINCSSPNVTVESYVPGKAGALVGGPEANWTTAKVLNQDTNIPYNDIQSALTAASEGDTILVGPGTYEEILSIDKPINLLGSNTGVSGSSARGEETILTKRLSLSGTNRIIIDGFKFFNSTLGQNNQTAVAINGNGNYSVINSIFERNPEATNEQLAEEGSKSIRGIEISAAGSGTITIKDNLFTGDSTNVWRNSSWQSAIYLNGSAVETFIQDNVFGITRTALNLDDFSDAVTVTGNDFTGEATHISFGGTSPTSGNFAITGNNFGLADAVFNLSNVAEDFRLDATNNTFNGKSPSAMTPDELFTLESCIYHKGKSGRNGFVGILPAYVFVTTAGGTINQAIAVAETGDTILIAPGIYDIGESQIVIDKGINLRGMGDAKPVIQGTAYNVGTYTEPMLITTVNNPDGQQTLIENISFEWKWNDGFSLGGNGNAAMLAGNNVRVSSCEFKGIDIPDTEYAAIVSIGQTGGNTALAGIEANKITFENNIVAGTISVVRSSEANLLTAAINNNTIDPVNMEGIWTYVLSANDILSISGNTITDVPDGFTAIKLMERVASVNGEAEFTEESISAANNNAAVKLNWVSKVSSMEDLRNAIASAVKGNVIILEAGEYTVTDTINVNKEITIQGRTEFSTVISTSGGSPVFKLSSPAILDGLYINKTDKANQTLVQITASGTTVKNSKFTGQYVQGDNEVVRAILPNAGVSFNIGGNHFENVRQPAYLQGAGTVADNFVKNTRGWVVCVNYAVSFTDNSFEGNAVDIAIIANKQDQSDNYTNIAALSTANNGAYVENQLIKASAKNGYLVVDAAGGQFMDSIQNAITAANPGDSIQVAAGTYAGFKVNKSDITLTGDTQAIITTVSQEGTIGGAGDVGILVDNATGVVINGFTVNGDSKPNSMGAAGFGTAEVTINNLTGIYLTRGIYANAADPAAGTVVTLTAQGCTFANCTVGIGGTENTILRAVSNSFTDVDEGIGLGEGVTILGPQAGATYEEEVDYLQNNNNFTSVNYPVQDYRTPIVPLKIDLKKEDKEKDPTKDDEDYQGIKEDGDDEPGEEGDDEPGEEGDDEPGEDGGDDPGEDGDDDPGEEGDDEPGEDGGDEPGEEGDDEPGEGDGDETGEDGDDEPGEDGDDEPGEDGEV